MFLGDPDGASSRGSLASALDRAGVGRVVPAEVGSCVQPVGCGRDRGFGLDALHQAHIPVRGEEHVADLRETLSRPGGGVLDASEDDDENDQEVMRIESSRKTAGGDVDAGAGAKPTAAGSNGGLPGAGEGTIDNPSGDSSSSAEINGGDSSAGGGSNSNVAGKSDGGNRSISGSGGVADANYGGSGQPPNRFLSRTRGETHRFAEADSFPSIGDIALNVECSRWSQEVIASTVAYDTLKRASLLMAYSSEQSEIFDPGGRTTVSWWAVSWWAMDETADKNCQARR